MTAYRLFPLAPLFLTAACASTPGEYPSLALRDAERVEGTFGADTADQVPAPPPPPIVPNADLAARLAELQRQASGFDARFRAAAPAAERLARAAGGTGSDSWAAAQVALADLDSLRSQAAVSLADLDTLWVDATLEPGSPREAIGAVRESVQAMIAAQDAVLARLRSRAG